MRDEMKSTLLAGLAEMDLSLEAEKVERLCDFGTAVVRQNEVMNLTAITQPSAVAKLHLLDSISILKVVDLRGKTLIDVGCGAGFPGVPLKIACPEMELTLLDSLGKRVHWLQSVLPTLNIQAECVAARAEEAVAQRRECYDFASSRAVARLNVLLELTAPFVKVGGKILAMKGSAAQQELEESGNAITKLGLRLEKVHHFAIDGADHALIVLQKVSPTPAQYPRRYAKIKQFPL